MGSDLVIFDSPSFRGIARREEICKAVQIEQLVANTSVERLNVCVLRRLSRIAELQEDVLLSAPLQHRAARKFTAAVEAYRLCQTSLHADSLENANDVAAAERKSHVDRQALSRKIIDGDHRPNRTPQIEAVMDKVDGPALIPVGRRRYRSAANVAHMPLATRTHFEPEGPVQPTKMPPREFEPVAAQHDHQASIPKARPSLSDDFDAFGDDRVVGRLARSVLRRLPRATG